MANQRGKVTASSLNLRTLPNTTTGVILVSLPSGTIVEILDTVTGYSYSTSAGTRNNWNEIKVGSQQGFAAAFFIQPISSAGLQGIVEKAPSGAKGFDCASKLNATLINKFINDPDNFSFCLRYLSLNAQNTSVDLSISEATMILNAGLALSPVQRVRIAGWSPTGSLGTTTGKNAADNADLIGFPPGVNVWLDLEGVQSGTPANNVIAYCNNWFDEVNAKGYVPGIYVGANAILNGNQLFDLNFQHYWKSGSTVPSIPTRGYQMIQTIPNPPLGELRHGIHIDLDKTQTDSLGGQVLWLKS